MLHMKLNEFMDTNVSIMKVKYEGYVYSNRTLIFVYTIKIQNICILFWLFSLKQVIYLKCTTKSAAKYQGLKSINNFSTLLLFYSLPHTQTKIPQMSIETKDSLNINAYSEHFLFFIICTTVSLQNIKRNNLFTILGMSLYYCDHCELQNH